jgi:hypothetical protein
MNTTLPTDSNDRKNYALFSGCLRYFPAALAGVSKTSKLGNDKHNPGQEMHHARNKSGDHGDCILRHLIDLEDLVAAMNRGEAVTEEHILSEVSSMAWRALALSQELHEKFGAPLAPGAKEGKDKYEVGLTIIPLNTKPLFQEGDVVKHINNDVEVEVQGTYFDLQGHPVLFVKDSDNKIFGVDPNFYKSIYAERKTNEGN